MVCFMIFYELDFLDLCLCAGTWLPGGGRGFVFLFWAFGGLGCISSVCDGVVLGGKVGVGKTHSIALSMSVVWTFRGILTPQSVCNELLESGEASMNRYVVTQVPPHP